MFQMNISETLILNTEKMMALDDDDLWMPKS